MEKPASIYVQVRVFARKKEEEEVQKIAYGNYKLDEFIYLIDEMNSLVDKVIAN